MMKTKQLLTHCYRCCVLLALVQIALVQPAKADIPPLLATPPPEQVLQQVSLKRVDAMPDILWIKDNVRAKLLTVRETGDQRLLGQAQQLMSMVSDDKMDIELRLLRASLLQSLHQFGDSTRELQKILLLSPANAQALLMLASIQLAQGNYSAASQACKALLGRAPMLISAGCASQVAARTGQAALAYKRLHQLYLREQNNSDDDVLHYTWVSLADIADQTGEPSAAHWWQKALQIRPRDLYTRIGAANNALGRGSADEVLAMTEHHGDVDALLLLRVQALSAHAKDEAAPAKDEAAALHERLLQRLEEARWRGDTLHARDQGWMLLRLKHSPEEALKLAQINWETQREPEDTRLLLDSALAAHRLDVYADAKQWLDSHQQWHARFPMPARTKGDRS